MEIKSDHAEAKAAQERLEAAKHSLTGRIEELVRRFNDTKREIEHKVDIKAHIQSRPFVAVGIALAGGVLAGLAGGAKRKETVVEKKTVQSKLTEAALAALGTLILKLVREAAFGELKNRAKQYFDQHNAVDGVRYAPSFDANGR